MKLQVALTHRTEYLYDRRVELGPHVVRLRPAPHCRTQILGYSLRVAPAAHFLNWMQDPFGNLAARVAVPEKTDAFSVTVDLVADMTAISPFDFFVDESAVRWPFSYEPSLAGDLRPYLETSPGTPLLERYLKTAATSEPITTIDFITRLNRTLSRDIAYRTRMEPGVQLPEETLTHRSGSCRDTGWLLVELLRRLGLAARFVSGYLIQLRPDARLDLEPGAAPEGVAEDFADLHAWAEVYIPGAGWIGLDPTSGLLTAEGHIPLAATPSPAGAAPITGSHGPAEVDFSVSMRVERLHEAPRVSAPYSGGQWQAILAAGAAVEERLNAGDVRVSMGGEPTFVALGDGAAPEWNTAALGPTKRQFADKLARRLCARFASGGLLHYGQGKWYPGETAARWAFGIYWRADREPLWGDATLIAEESATPPSIAGAERFARELCRTLGLPADSAVPAYEDVAHFMLAEQKLPPGAAPESNALADPAERARLMRVFERGLDQPVGYVLPLLMMEAAEGKRRFITERWAFRRGHLFLIPGDSAIGLRLPLAGLAQIDFVDYPHVLPADPFADAGKLPKPRGELEPCQAHADKTEAAAPGQPVRTALAVEVRDGATCACSCRPSRTVRIMPR
jgi:transglutaminase-like putative cysteine protease